MAVAEAGAGAVMATAARPRIADHPRVLASPPGKKRQHRFNRSIDVAVVLH